MKTLEVCSKCGSYDIVSFEYDSGRNGPPRLLSHVNIDEIDIYSDVDRHYFDISGKKCLNCRATDQTYMFEVKDCFKGNKDMMLLNKIDSILLNINRDIKETISLSRENKLALVNNIKYLINEIMIQENVSDRYDELCEIRAKTRYALKFNYIDEYLQSTKKYIESILNKEED